MAKYFGEISLPPCTLSDDVKRWRPRRRRRWWCLSASPNCIALRCCCCSFGWITWNLIFKHFEGHFLKLLFFFAYWFDCSLQHVLLSSQLFGLWLQLHITYSRSIDEAENIQMLLNNTNTGAVLLHRVAFHVFFFESECPFTQVDVFWAFCWWN